MRLALQIKDEFNIEITDCKTGVEEDLVKIEGWGAGWGSPTSIIQTLVKNIVHHGIGIRKEFALAKDDFSAGKYFEAGKDAAQIVTLILGPVPNAI